MSNGMRGNLSRGAAAGFIATLVLSMVMLMKQAMGIMPELNPVQMITQMMGSQNTVLGWTVHFMIGTVMWGIAFGLLDTRLSGAHWFRGAVFSTGAWLLMMIVMMPMAGAGLFGLNMGMTAPAATLIMHWIYGAVLGGVFGALVHRQERHSRMIAASR